MSRTGRSLQGEHVDLANVGLHREQLVGAPEERSRDAPFEVRAFVQDLRLERAAHLLRTTRDTVDQVALAVGYGDASTLRTLLRKKLGKGVRELRAR